MAFFARKVHGCMFIEKSGKYHVSLIEHSQTVGHFSRFVLFLKIVPSTTEKKIEILRGAYLHETDVTKIMDQYFSPRGEVRKDFPGKESDIWKITRSWLPGLLRVADSGKTKSNWMRVEKSQAASRPKTGFRFWKGHNHKLLKREWSIGKTVQ